jgi:damage-control phosphatase, subfamily I
MLLKPDCIPCILTMSLDLLRKLSISEREVNTIYKQILELPALRGESWQTTSPQVIETIMKYMQDAVGDSDPFCSVKQNQNDQVAAIYPDLKKWVQMAPEPLDTAVKLAIIGNAIDFMIAGGPSNLTSFIRNKLDSSISKTNLSKFKERLSAAHTILYFTDNCGEVILDKLLIETVKESHPAKEVYFVVRSMPALNDATVKEAHAVGLDSVGTIVENGIDGPLPGTILSRCSKQVKELIEQADLVISKGGGNFDTLGEEIDALNTDISFLLLSKCFPYTKFFEIGMHEPAIFNVFH